MDKNRKRRAIGALLGVSAAALAIVYFENILGALGVLWKVAFPLALGGAIAYILNILLVKLEKHYFPRSGKKIVAATRRPACIALSVALVLGVLALVMGLVLPELVNTASVLAKAAQDAAIGIKNYFLLNADRFPSLASAVESLQIDWANTLQKAASVLTNGVGSLLSSTVATAGAFAGGVVNFVLAFIFAMFLLSGKERLLGSVRRLMKAYLRPGLQEKVLAAARTANETFSAFIAGQCVEAAILGVLCALGMWAFRFPYALMIGAFIGLTALIPMAGAYLGAAVGAFLILMVDPVKALLFLVFIVVLQQLEGNLIYPKVVGTSIGLPGLWVLAAVVVFGGLGGIVGMLIGVPATASAYKLLKKDVNERLAIRQDAG